MKEKLEPLQAPLDLNAAELKKIVLLWPAVLNLSYEDNVKPTLAQLQQHLDLDAMQLKKIVLGLPAVLGYVPANVFNKLRHQQECLGLTDEELKVAVIAQPQCRWATGKSRRSGR
jgi:hypothetical protein